MRSVLFLFALMLGLASCDKDREVTEPQSVKVCFGYHMVSEVPMTKAVVNNEINDWIEAQLPQTISLRLTDANGTRYNIQTNNEVEIPVGIYTVTGKSVPSSTASLAGTDLFLSNTAPTITVNTTVEITYSQKTYVIPATYGAFGIVVDYDETSSVSFQSSHGETGNVTFATIGTAGIAFINGNLSGYSIMFSLTPVSTANEVTKYTFQATYSESSISPANGNYYILHPRSVSSVDGGTFVYSIGGFRAVDVQ